MNEIYELKKELKGKEKEEREEIVIKNIEKFKELVRNNNINFYVGNLSLFTEIKVKDLYYLSFDLEKDVEGRICKKYTKGILRNNQNISFDLEYPVRRISGELNLEEKNLLRGRLNKALISFFGENYKENLKKSIELTKASLEAEIKLIELEEKMKK